eukprot:3038611-Prorocentrum_lima.AAC.1
MSGTMNSLVGSEWQCLSSYLLDKSNPVLRRCYGECAAGRLPTPSKNGDRAQLRDSALRANWD